MTPLKIGELSSRLAVPIETIRYYEREGLLPAIPRTSGNYRLYGPEVVERLTFIRNCRVLDMTLEEIRGFLAIKDMPDQQCGTVNAHVDDHIEQIDQRIADLMRLKSSLQALRARCDVARNAKDCGILNELTHEHDPHTLCRDNA